MPASTPYRFPARIADLGFSVELPGGWTVQPLPDEVPDFDNPTTMAALAIVTAPHAAIVFSFAARPAFSHGTLLDWSRYLLDENGLQPLALVEDGARLLNITLTAPDALASSIQAR